MAILMMSSKQSQFERGRGVLWNSRNELFLGQGTNCLVNLSNWSTLMLKQENTASSRMYVAPHFKVFHASSQLYWRTKLMKSNKYTLLQISLAITALVTFLYFCCPKNISMGDKRGARTTRWHLLIFITFTSGDKLHETR